MSGMQSQILRCPIADEGGGQLWWAITFDRQVVVYEAGFYALPGISSECQSDRAHRFIHSQPLLEPSHFETAP